MFDKTATTITCALCLTLPGCSDPKSANESNYRSAIEGYFEQRDDFPHCVFRYNLPLEGNERQIAMWGIKSQLDILTKLGLLEHQSTDLAAKAAEFGRQLRYGDPKTMNHYQLTSSGQKYYIPERGICIGKAKLLELQEISKPYEERGRTQVRGEYLWTIELPDWAMQPEFHQADAFSGELYYFKYDQLLNNQPITDFFTLTLKDDGWGF